MDNNYATAQGYQTGNPYVTPMMYNQAMQVPSAQMNNPLTEEERKLLLNEQDTFNLKVTPEDIARAVCTHKYPEKRTYATIPGTEADGDVTCAICHTKFYPDLVTPEYVQKATDSVLNVLQTLKLLGVDLSNEVIRQYFSMIPYIEKIPKLYETLNNAFAKYNMGNPIVQSSSPNIYSMYNMLANPAVAMPQQYPYYNNMYGMQNNMVAGGSPFYAQQPQQPQAPYMNQPMQQQMMPQQPMMQQPMYGYPMQQQMMPQQPVAPQAQPAPQPPVAAPAQDQQPAQDVHVTQPVQL